MLISFLLCFPTSAQEAAAGPPINLQQGRTIRREISGKTIDAYSMALTSAQCAQLVVEQRGIDVVVQVVDEQNKVVAEFDADMRPQGRENVIVAPHESTTYGVHIKPRYSRVSAGAYEIQLVEIRVATEQDRRLFEAHRLEPKPLH